MSVSSRFSYTLIAIAGLALLMVVHELGHLLTAQRFKMRVTKFSIGFGPTIWKHQPRGSSTVYQVALIPFVAYVQIAGMNPFEDGDSDDPESYANASLTARILTIAGGPLANYFFATVLIFFGLIVGGQTVSDETSMRIHPLSDGPAAQAGFRDGDRIVEIGGEHVANWHDMSVAISSRAGKETEIVIERAGETLRKTVTPEGSGDNRGHIMVEPVSHHEDVSVGMAIKLGIIMPPQVVYEVVRTIGRWIARLDKVQVSGPFDMVKGTAQRVALGPGVLLQFLGSLSAYLCAFNLLPIPALDGGRLLFLGAEAVSRRKLDAKIEQGIHAVGLLMFLTLIAVVTVNEITRH